MSLFALSDKIYEGRSVNFNLIPIIQIKLSQSRNMTGLLFVLSNLKIRYCLPWKQKYFTAACRNKYTFINCQCQIASTIDIENSTL